MENETPDSQRWADFLTWAQDNGWDNDEYVSWNQYAELCSKSPDTQMFFNQDCIAIYWRPGGCEGYYAHVDTLRDGRYETRVVAKFWNPDRAAAFCEAATRWIYKGNGCL